jgi:putative ubiquitin-RnfH superfamily antitoxin RatB of RatAB toxin-antitoxin module
MLQLTIAWTCVGIFIATAIITLLALIGMLKLADKKYLDRLVKVLIVEVCAACVAAFTGQVELPSTVEKRVEDAGHERAAKEIEPKVEAMNTAIAAREKVIAQYIQQLPSGALKPEDRTTLTTPLRLDPKVLRRLRDDR